jgi:hypothetical protein
LGLATRRALYAAVARGQVPVSTAASAALKVIHPAGPKLIHQGDSCAA